MLVCFLTVKPDYRRQNVTDAVDFQMQLAKPAHFGDPFRSTTRILTNTPVNSTPRFQAARDLVF
jgi:hypothetical protein